MAKKQKSFADKASGNKNADAVYVKYVKSVKSDKSGQWRFNEQIVRTNKGEQLDAALKRMDEVANLVDIDLSQFIESPETTREDFTSNKEKSQAEKKSASEEKPVVEEKR